MADEYVVPIGVDGAGAFKGLQDIANELDKVQAKANSTGKSIEDAFNKGADSAEELDQKLKPAGKALTDLGEQGKKTGKSLEESLDVTKEVEDLSKEVDKATKKLEDQKKETDNLTASTKAQTAATKLGTIAGKAFGVMLKTIGIGLVTAALAYLVANMDKLIKVFDDILPAGKGVQFQLDRLKSVAMGVGEAVIQFLITPFKAVGALLQGNFKEFGQVIKDGFSLKKNFQEGYNKQELATEREHYIKLEEEKIASDQRDLDRRKARGENITADQIALQKRLVDLYDKESEDYKKALEGLEDLQDKNTKDMASAADKASKDAQKKGEQDAKKALADQKAMNAEILSQARQLADMRIAAIQDENERERQAIEENYQRKIEDLNKTKALSEEAIKQRTDIEAALLEDRNAKLLALDEENNKKVLDAQIAAQIVLTNLMEEGLDKSLSLLQLDHEQRLAEIKKNYADDEALQLELITALNESTAREEAKLKSEAAVKSVELEEEKQLLIIEAMGKYAKGTERAERQKQIAILAVQLEYAQKRLDALIAAGGKENDLAVLQARAMAVNLKKELDSAIKENEGKGFSLIEFMGLDDQDGEAVSDAFKKIQDNVKKITDFIVSQYDRQIDKKQEVIDQLGKDSKELDKQLEKEKKLRDQGYANNVATIELELAAKQKQKDEEIKQQEELMRKREEIQRAQLAMDTAIQLTNMITASTAIFKALAGIPFIGIPLAIATIGTMFGAFAVAKMKASQSISDGSKMGDGGWIDGKSHAEGGKKYYSPDGDVKELERDEFVVRARRAKRYPNFMEAFNNGDFSAMDINDGELRSVLKEMGIDMSETSSKRGLDAAGANVSNNTMIVNNPQGDKEMREMNENIRYLAQKEREKVESWEDEKYVYIKQGSRTTRIKKN